MFSISGLVDVGRIKRKWNLTFHEIIQHLDNNIKIISENVA